MKLSAVGVRWAESHSAAEDTCTMSSSVFCGSGGADGQTYNKNWIFTLKEASGCFRISLQSTWFILAGTA